MGIKKTLVAAAAFVLVLALAGCGGAAGSAASSSAESSSQSAQVSSSASSSGASGSAAQSQGIDYLALVNKLNPLPEGWEDALQTAHFTNTVGDDVEVEQKAYDAYLALKADLEEEGVHVDLDSARRSVADQQRIMDDFTKEYGADYAKKTVAEPGC